MKRNEFDQDKPTLQGTVKNEIFEAVKGISFGEVVITIHDSRVVQIERKEKKRFS
ncbi:MAG: YezD family protein [Candidatus Omnitrophica bacterium]|nr:YezD family protein [Candidatus Omnitrophota bacterium]MDD4013068.1 YezD family protein [Candidatus Omnitrophota bacterium]